MQGAEFSTIDDWVYKQCVAIWGISTVWDAFAIVIAKWTPVVMLAVIAIAALGFAWPVHTLPSPMHLAFTAVAAALVARTLNEPLSRLFHRPRPFESSVHTPLIDHEGGDSFPSNHATGAFALSGAFLGHPPYAGILFTLAILLALSRIYTGLHYFSDVLAGIVNGMVVSVLVTMLIQTIP